jgi:ferredoxin
VRITVDRSRCVTSGQCMSLAPELFDQDEEGFSVALRDPATAAEMAAALSAARICPARAIAVTETDVR